MADASDKRTTPASVFKEFKRAPKEDRKYAQDLEKARAEGVEEGYLQARTEILTLIQEKFMDPELHRKSPEAQALLTIAREISNEAYKDKT